MNRKAIALLSMTFYYYATSDCFGKAPGESLAKLYYNQNRLGLCLLEYNRAIAEDPGNSEALRGRGLAFLRMGRIDKALEDLQQANSNLGPYRETKFPGLGGYLDWQNAHEDYLIGNTYLRTGAYQRAMEKYRGALLLYPTFPQCLHNLGIILAKTGQHEQAAIACMEAISYRHDDWKFWNTLALELFALGRYRTSLQAMEHARDLKPPAGDEADIIEAIEKIKDTFYAHQK